MGLLVVAAAMVLVLRYDAPTGPAVTAVKRPLTAFPGVTSRAEASEAAATAEALEPVAMVAARPAGGGLAEQLQDEFSAIAEKVKPTVVYVDVTRPLDMPQGYQFYEREGPDSVIPPQFREFSPFREPGQWREWNFSPNPQAPRARPHPRSEQMPKAHGVGSGVIIDARNGYVLTNNHVVEGASEIGVTLYNDNRYTAKVKGTDPRTDLAVIKIDAEGLREIQWGDSDALEVGHWVMAFGQPEGLKYTVTKGIVSAKGRVNLNIIGSQDEIGGYEDFIQTDAAINPGNSGGPLTNIRGELVGINTAIATQGIPQWGGIGFAIPSNLARRVAEQLIEKGEVTRGYIGAALMDLVAKPDRGIDTKEIRDPRQREAVAKQQELLKKAGADVKGAYIAEVLKGLPAEAAGIKAGDVITKFEGKPIEDRAMLRNLVAQTKVGSKVNLELLRLDGDKVEPVSVKVEIAEQPKVAGAEAAPEAVVSGELGLAVQTLTPQIAEDLGYDKDEKGAVVTGVARDSRARKAGLRVDDLITQIKLKGKETKVESAEDFEKAISQIGGKESFSVLVKRGEQSMYVKIE